VNLERGGRLLLALAGALGLIGMVVADSRDQYGRYLALSGCLVMLALALMLLAPRPAARVERRARPARRPEQASTPPRLVPQQRSAAAERDTAVPAGDPVAAERAAAVARPHRAA
jgi:hypothetical protein